MGDKQFGVFRGLGIVLAGIVVVGLASCATTHAKAEEIPASQRQRTLLDAGWAFHLGDISPNTEVIAAGYDDKMWKRVDVPHDYVLDGKYNEKDDRGHGYLPVDVGWYRKRLMIPASDGGKILKLDFDGVFRDSEVWLNGQSLGKHASGYTPFSFDITKLAKIGEENIIAVRLDPRKGEGWWYEGGGIYRHVYLTALAPVHLTQWGTHVVTTVPGGEKGADAEGDVTITTAVENSGSAAANYKIVSEILGPDGATIKKIEATDTTPAGGRHEAEQRAVIDHPKLWSIQAPQLYRVRTTVVQDGTTVDSSVTTFGVRTIHYDPNKGFFLNGQHVEIQGTASHQDFTGVGIAVPDSLQAWRVAQLKKTGCNAWRTAHNPPSEALLKACDELGMLVMDENRHLGATYNHHSPKGTPAGDLADLATMIQRDRNHPSIIMWSMCNEEGLQGTAEGKAIFSAMMNVVHQYDNTRPITSAMNAGWLKEGDADVEDIIGVNYNTNRYDAIHQKHPDKTVFGSEDTNEKTARGEYEDVPATGMRSGYNLSVEGWQAVITRPFMAGSFTWTGFDYKGEPNPYGWPDVSNNTGLLDSCGFPKDRAYYFQSCWSDKPMVHLMPASWNWAGKEDKNIRVIAFSNAQKVELFLNGQSLGSKDMPHDGSLEWQVPYKSGTLLAKGYVDGKAVSSDELQTTGAAARIELNTDRTTLATDGEDTVVAAVSIFDDKGRLVPDAANRITFHLTGGGRILGVGNGNPADHDTDKADQRNAFHGRCIAVVQAGSQAGELQLTASSPGLADGSVTFKIR